LSKSAKRFVPAFRTLLLHNMRSWVNFTYILCAAFASFSNNKKITQPNCKWRKTKQNTFEHKNMFEKYWWNWHHEAVDAETESPYNLIENDAAATAVAQTANFQTLCWMIMMRWCWSHLSLSNSLPLFIALSRTQTQIFLYLSLSLPLPLSHSLFLCISPILSLLYTHTHSIFCKFQWKFSK